VRNSGFTADGLEALPRQANQSDPRRWPRSLRGALQTGVAHRSIGGKGTARSRNQSGVCAGGDLDLRSI